MAEASDPSEGDDPTKDPSVDPDRIEAIYEALAKMQVELDPDPLALGPKRLNGKIAACRTMLSSAQTIYLDVSQSLHRFKRRLRAASADFKLQMKNLLANDPEVRMGRNVADRDAVASTKLRAEQEQIDRLTSCVEDLESVMVVVNVKRGDLKDIQGRLRDQLKVCQEEIGLGGRWGKGLPTMRAADPAGDEVKDLLENLMGKMEQEEAQGVPESPTFATSSTKIPRTTEGEPLREVRIPVEMIGGPSIKESDQALADIPEEVPVVDHPDGTEPFFSDESLDDILNNL